jgi:hypothetical protein
MFSMTRSLDVWTESLPTGCYIISYNLAWWHLSPESLFSTTFLKNHFFGGASRSLPHKHHGSHLHSKFSENIIFPICNSANSSDATYVSGRRRVAMFNGILQEVLRCYATQIFSALAQWWKRWLSRVKEV